MTTLGRYEILEKLGTGSMGTVYRARDSVLDREVALKTIRTGADVEPEIRERFYREARACARLQHPGIVAVYDLNEVDRTAFIAMELLIGADFRKVIEQRLELPLEIKLGAMIQICSALAHAHRRGIIHRDIKPSNLFLVEQRDAKVLDFGIARLPSSHLTVAGKILGTPNYMAPEQILTKPADPRSDLFSAAVVFFEFLVYAHPFEVPGKLIPQRVVEGEPDSLFVHDSKLPIVLNEILARALARDPEQRYRTGDAFADDLKALLDAIRHNASPSFSHLELPSQRDLPIPVERPRDPAPAPAVLVPAGEDPYEWRLSEVLRLIPEFEGAIDRRDRTAAQQALGQIEAIEAADARFSEALRMCRGQFETLQPSRPITYSPPATRPVTYTSKICPNCGVSNRQAAQYCIRCGSEFGAPSPPQEPIADDPLNGTHPAPPPVQLRPSQLDEDPLNRSYDPPAPYSIPRPAPPPPTVHPELVRKPEPARKSRFWVDWPARQKQATIIVGGAGLIILLTALIVWLSWPVKPRPAFATAVVAPAQAFLYADQTGDSHIRTLYGGDRMNILHMPRVGAERVAAQFVGRQVSKPGFVRLRDLDPASWVAKNADENLDLILLLFPGDSGNPEDIEKELNALQALSTGNPGSKAASRAELESARLDLALIKRKRDAGEPPENWASLLDQAKAHLQAAGGDVSLAADVAGLQSQVDQITAELTPPAPATPVVKRPAGRTLAQINQDLDQADQLFTANSTDSNEQLGNLNQASRMVDRVLKEQPKNQRAMDLKNKIDAAKALYSQKP